MLVVTNTNALNHITPHPPPPQGGRVRVGVIVIYLVRLY